MAIFAGEAVTGGELGPAFIILPHFVKARLARGRAQGAFLENVALCIAFQFDEPGLLASVPAVGEDDQYFSLHDISTQAQTEFRGKGGRVNSFDA